MGDDAPRIKYNGHELPATWAIGDFTLEAAVRTGASGQAWLTIPYARAHPLIIDGPRFTVVEADPAVPRLVHAVEVVDEVAFPETQVSIADALALRPGVRIGDTIAVDFA